MHKEKLKQMWLSLPHSNPVDDIRVIRVERLGSNHYYVERVTDTKDYWSTSGANFRTMQEAIQYANAMKVKHNNYELFIHGST